MKPPSTTETSRTARRSVRPAAVAATALSLALGGLTLPGAAWAAPAPEASTSSFGLGAQVAGTVPDGICAVRATVVGGAGGRSAAGANGTGSNGAGAAITATFAVTPGTTFSGTVGGGGRENVNAAGGAGGVNGGGTGGTAVSQHGGAGGGGSTVLFLGGTTPDDVAVLAGGGGGSGGGHSVTTDGFGGDAGLPAGAGEVAAGADGTDGFEGGPQVGGGQGGRDGQPGAGGVHSTDPSLNGQPGAGSAGGAGAADPNYDAGGGGGAGLTGGGGGASTIIKNSDNGINTVAGGGGGGGSSFVAGTASDVTSAASGRQTGTGKGADGSIELDWVECGYDLAVTKTASVDGAPTGSPDRAPVGSTVTWAVTVVNNGPEAMTRGDILTLTDTLPGDGATSVTSVVVAGGTNDTFERGPLSCDAVVGSPLPSTVTCSREHALLGGAADGRRGLDVGESVTITYTQAVTDTPGTTLENTATVQDRGDQDDNSDTSVVTVVGPPAATDDSDLGNTIGETVRVPVLGNDTATTSPLDPTTLVLWDPATSTSPGLQLVVPGEGTWTVEGGDVVFTPVAGFLTDPTPVSYRISDEDGLTATAVVTVDYVPAAADDSDLGHTIGDVVTVDVLTNDTGDLDPSTVVLVDGSTRTDRLVVPGEGTWTVVPTTGAVVFTPEAGFLTDPTPITYEVTDTTGDTTSARVTVGYVPDATDDVDHGNTIGEVVTVDVLTNDAGDLDPTTVVLVDGEERVSELVVPGEGTWTVDPTTGAVTFAPADGFTGNPTPVTYEVTDSTGDLVSATVTVTYLPVATDDAKHGNTVGSPVVVDVLPNDTGSVDRSSLRLVDPVTGERVLTVTVPGEGTWTVQLETGTVTFVPEDGFTKNPTPVTYEVLGTAGDPVSALVVVTYLPQAQDDVDVDNVRGTPVTVDVVGNDTGTLDPSSVRLVDPATGELVTTLTVPGEGTWTVDLETGAVTFVPLDGFEGDPTPVTYQVTDVEGNLTTATITVTYLAEAPAPTPAPSTPAAPAAPTAPAAPAAPARPGAALATTGTEVLVASGTALALVLAGAAGLVLRRRRTTRS